MKQNDLLSKALTEALQELDRKSVAVDSESKEVRILESDEVAPSGATVAKIRIGPEWKVQVNLPLDVRLV